MWWTFPTQRVKCQRHANFVFIFRHFIYVLKLILYYVLKLILFFSPNRVSLCNPGWLWTHKNLLVSVSWVVGLIKGVSHHSDKTSTFPPLWIIQDTKKIGTMEREEKQNSWKWLTFKENPDCVSKSLLWRVSDRYCWYTSSPMSCRSWPTSWVIPPGLGSDLSARKR